MHITPKRTRNETALLSKYVNSQSPENRIHYNALNSDAFMWRIYFQNAHFLVNDYVFGCKSLVLLKSEAKTVSILLPDKMLT